MVKKLSKTEATSVLGVAGDNTRNGQIRADEFLAELRGKKAINKFREMRDNDSTIGAVMYATEQVLRDVDLKVFPANDTPAAQREADFVQSVLADMEHSLDDHVAEALSSLSYGFAWFEVYISAGLDLRIRTLRKSLSSLMDVWVSAKLLFVRLGQSLGLK